MAAIIWNAGEEVFLNVVLNGTTTGFNTNSAAIPNVGGTWGLGMGACAPLGTATQASNKSFNNGTNSATTICEIGQSAANGYGRTTINRNTSGTGWPLSTVSSGSHQSQAPQQTFSFTGAPTVNGATLWFVAKSSTLGAVDCLFGADLATTRNFANQDTEKITVIYRQT